VSRSRAVLALATSVALVAAACTKASPDAGAVSEGPHISLDTAKVRELRAERKMTDSALSLPDTAKGEHAAREFVALLKPLRLIEAQETLGRLGYGIAISGELDAPTRRAFREFARRHGVPLTDSLSAEMELALKYSSDRSFVPFALHDLTVWTSNWTAPSYGSVHAQGTWSPADPPRQTSSIWCYHDLRVCRETVAYVLMGNLYTDEIEYTVELWDNEELTARSNSTCMSDKLTINRSQESLVLVRSARGADLEFCVRTRSANRESVSRLVDGRTVTDSLNYEGMKFIRLGPKAATLLRKVQQMSKATDGKR